MPSHEELQGAERDLNHVLMIKAYLGGIQAIRETLEAADCTSQLLRWVLEKCGHGSTAPIVGLIQEAIEQDAVFSKAPIDTRNNRLWAIKVSVLSKIIPCSHADDTHLVRAQQRSGGVSPDVSGPHERDAPVRGRTQQDVPRYVTSLPILIQSSLANKMQST
jgi:hypothetical protein